MPGMRELLERISGKRERIAGKRERMTGFNLVRKKIKWDRRKREKKEKERISGKRERMTVFELVRKRGKETFSRKRTDK